MLKNWVGNWSPRLKPQTDCWHIHDEAFYGITKIADNLLVS